MELINNRYRVIKVLTENFYLKTYLVSDILRRYGLLSINILKNGHVTEELIDFLSKEFIYLKSLNCRCTVELYEYGIVTDIDNRPMNERLYYFSTEYVDNIIDTSVLISEVDMWGRLDLFCEICCIVNTLHLKGILYNDIDKEHILFVKQEGKVGVKLKDIVSAVVIGSNNGEDLERVYGITENERDMSNLSGQLIDLCTLFFKKADYIGEDSSAEGMIASTVETLRVSGIQSVSGIIDYINCSLGRNYREFNMEDMERLNFRSKMAGRREIKESFLKRINELQKGETEGLLTAVHGETGIGKTRLLDEIAHCLTIKGIKVFRHSVSNAADTGYSIVRLARQMLLCLEGETALRYEMEFSEILPVAFNDDIIINKDIVMERKVKYKIVNRLSALMNEVAGRIPFLLIIDGLDMCNEVYLDLVEYIFGGVSPNFMCLFGYNDNDLEKNEKFKEFYERVSTGKFFWDIRLEPLTERETIEMIRNILGTACEIGEIGRTIYSITYGNPLFIEEVIKDLFLKKEIYMDIKSGSWSTCCQSIKEIPIPVNLEDAMISQLKGMDEKAVRVLTSMAVFSRKSDIGMLTRMSGLGKEETSCILIDLIRKGIVSESLKEGRAWFNYSNRILKKMIYDKLEYKERRDAHKSAVNIIEENMSECASEDIIYHLEGAGDMERLYEYCVSYADNLEKKNLKDGAIGYLEKAVSIFGGGSKDERYIALLLRLGNLYKRNGSIQNALKCYAACIENAPMDQLTHIRIRALTRSALIYFNKNEIEECIKYLDNAEKAVMGSVEYNGEMLEINLLKVRIFERRQQYEAAFQVCRESLKMCTEAHLKGRGEILKALGNLYLYTGNIQMALQNYEKSIVCFEEVHYLKGTLWPLNSIGLIWEDYFQNEDKSMEYFFRLKEISEKNGFLEYDIAALTSIGENYFNKVKYEEALKCFLEALEKAKRFYIESSIFHNCIYIVHTYLMLQDYSNVLKYCAVLNNELLSHPEQGVNMRHYYRVLAMVYLNFGELERAELLITAAQKKYNDENSISRWHTQFVSDLIRLYSDSCEAELRDTICDIEQTINYVNKKQTRFEMLYDTCIALYLRGFLDESRMLFEKYASDSSETDLNAKKLFIEAVSYSQVDNLKRLMAALEAAIKCKNEELRWRICCYIGDCYYNKGNLFHSVNYYFEAAEIVRALTNSLPEGKRLAYFDFNNMIEPFRKLMNIRKIHERLKVEPDEEWMVVSSEKKMNQLFKYEDLNGVISSSKFIKSAQIIFDKVHNNNIKDIRDLLRQLGSDPIYNLEIAITYLSRVTLAKNAYILREEMNGSITVLAGEKLSAGAFQRKSVIEKVRCTKKPIIITDKMTAGREHLGESVNAEGKVIICLPVTLDRSSPREEGRQERRSKGAETASVLGYVYLEAERLLNNFNHHTLELCSEVIPLIGFTIEKHLLRISSSIDKLTKTLTRKNLEDALEEQIYRCQNEGRVFSVIMFDLDYFKTINDKFGHQVGDNVLAGVCSLVLGGIRKNDCCGRYGGEEFVIILPDTDISGAELVGEKIRKKVEREKLLGSRASITISLGAASYPIHGGTVKEIMEKADQALYAAKKLGRNRCQSWNENFKEDIHVTDSLTGIISGNLARDHRNISAMIEIMNFIKDKNSIEDKIYRILGRVIEITESHQGFYFILQAGGIAGRYSRKAFSDGWQKLYFNENIINEVIRNRKGKCLIDWDGVYDCNPGGGIPDWKSVAAVPVIKNGIVKAVVALAVSARVKEFYMDDLNFISVLSQLSEGMF